MTKSFQLWRCLRYPPRNHPVFRHTAAIARHSHPPIPRWIQIAGGLGLLFIICAIWSPSMILAGLAILFASPVVFLVANGTVYGLLWAVSASGILRRYRQHGAHELLSLSPTDPLEIDWLFCQGTLHRGGGLEQIHTAVRLLLGLGLGFVLVITFFTTTNAIALSDTATGPATIRLAFTVLLGYPLLGALYIDHIQSTVISGLVAILIADIARSDLECRVWSAGLFLGLQVIVYTGIGVGLLPILAWRTGLSGSLSLLGGGVLALFILYTLRESLVQLLWTLIKRRLRADYVR